MRKQLLFALAVVGIASVASVPRASETAVTPDDVIEMMAKIPTERSGPKGKPAGYDKSGDAKIIAKAISVAAVSRDQASRMAVYSSFESSNQSHARGDCDRATGYCKSKGAWQLRNVPDDVADDPMRAAPAWLFLAKDAEERCAANPPEERLAVVASGSCSRARKKARNRYEIAKSIAAE